MGIRRRFECLGRLRATALSAVLIAAAGVSWLAAATPPVVSSRAPGSPLGPEVKRQIRVAGSWSGSRVQEEVAEAFRKATHIGV